MSEEEQLEKKRPGTEEFESEEELLNRQKKPDDDEHDDWLFDEDDSDLDLEDDFTKGIAELGYDGTDAPMVEEEKDDGIRRCLKVHVCNIYQHAANFHGLPFFELFKVRLKFNDMLSTNTPFTGGKIHGEVVTFQPCHAVKSISAYDEENPFPISYYRVSGEDPDTVDLDSDKKKYILLPLSGPTPRPPIHENYALCIDFALRINNVDIFTSGVPHLNPALFGDENRDDPPKAATLYLPPSDLCDRSMGGPVIGRQVLGFEECDRILLSAKYTVYDGAWADVEVTMLKDGVSSFYGVIMARPCIFYSRICLLSIQPDNKLRIQRARKGEVDEKGLIKLTRSVVAVPSYSSLIIGAQLYEHGKDKLICRGRTYFPAKESGEETKFISYNGVQILQVKVIWKCQLKLQNRSQAE